MNIKPENYKTVREFNDAVRAEAEKSQYIPAEILDIADEKARKAAIIQFKYDQAVVIRDINTEIKEYKSILITSKSVKKHVKYNLRRLYTNLAMFRKFELQQERLYKSIMARQIPEPSDSAIREARTALQNSKEILAAAIRSQSTPAQINALHEQCVRCELKWRQENSLYNKAWMAFQDSPPLNYKN